MSSADDPQPPGQEPAVSPLRPYLLTSGRAKPIDETLEIEAQVLTSRLGATSAAIRHLGPGGTLVFAGAA